MSQGTSVRAHLSQGSTDLIWTYPHAADKGDMAIATLAQFTTSACRGVWTKTSPGKVDCSLAGAFEILCASTESRRAFGSPFSLNPLEPNSEEEPRDIHSVNLKRDDYADFHSLSGCSQRQLARKIWFSKESNATLMARGSKEACEKHNDLSVEFITSSWGIMGRCWTSTTLLALTTARA